MVNGNIITLEVGNGNGEALEMAKPVPYGDIEVEKVKIPDFESMVLAEESAEDVDEEANVYARCQDLGYFSPVRGMANIRNVCNDSLYAQIYVDEKQERYIEFCQQYKDGSFSPTMRWPQSGMRMAGKYHFSDENVGAKQARQIVTKFIATAYNDYYKKIQCGEDIELEDILNALYNALPKLPEKKAVPNELSPKDFYRMLMLYINDFDRYPIFEHKSYFMLDEEGIEGLAHKMGMTRLDLLRQLQKYGYLYQTKSEKGYQANVRLTDSSGQSFTVRFYCIFKLKFFAGFEEKKPKIDF